MLPFFSLLSQQLSAQNYTKCESNQSNNSIHQPKQGALPASLMEQQQQSGKLIQEEREESCTACLVTGMATCTGLSLYFAKLALLEVPDITPSMSAKVAAQHRRSRAGFLVVSAGWVAVGAYRWHLG